MKANNVEKVDFLLHFPSARNAERMYDLYVNYTGDKDLDVIDGLSIEDLKTLRRTIDTILAFDDRYRDADRLTDRFGRWAAGYFSYLAHLDRTIPLYDVMMDFNRFQALSGDYIPASRFIELLEAFCAEHPHIECLNPAELCGANGRIVREVCGQTVPCIYVRSTAEVRSAAEEDMKTHPEAYAAAD